MFCKNCGKEISDDSKFCQYCGLEIQNNIENPKANNKTNDLGYGKGCLIAIVIFFGLVFIGGLSESGTDSTSTKTKTAKQEQTVKNIAPSKEEQERLKTVNKLIEDAKKGGLIIKFKQAFVGDMAQEEPNVYVCVVDEYVWNQLPHETKQQIVSLMEDYSKIKGWKIISFEGYRTGKSIVNAMYAVKNF